MVEALSLIWEYVLPFLVVLTVLVFVHEMGHYLAARRCGVRVEVFSVGFGREIFGWTDRVGTRWKFSMIPFGGYVKMFGEMQSGGEAETDENRARTARGPDRFIRFQNAAPAILHRCGRPAREFPVGDRRFGRDVHDDRTALHAGGYRPRGSRQRC